MKKLTLLTILLFSISSVTSQSCLPEGIHFETQAQIDNFQINYPGCTEIEGDVTIWGGWQSDITNLDGLNVLTSIGGGLKISTNFLLEDLTGLSNLTSIGIHFEIGSLLYSLFITGNHMLTDLTGLNNVTSVAGPLEISGNNGLTDITGIGNIDAATIEFSIGIQNNWSLSSCEAQSICDFISNGGTTHIYNNAPGCNSTEEVETDCEDLSIEDPDTKVHVIIYPNPTKEEFNISAEGYSIKEVSIFTLAGHQVHTIKHKNSTIDISSLKPGMYIVEVIVDNRRIRQKLLVQR